MFFYRKINDDNNFNKLLKEVLIIQTSADKKLKETFDKNVQIIVSKFIKIIPTINCHQNIQLLNVLAQKNIRDFVILDAISAQICR